MDLDLVFISSVVVAIAGMNGWMIKSLPIYTGSSTISWDK